MERALQGEQTVLDSRWKFTCILDIIFHISSISQRSYGKSVSWSSKQVGDLICYNAINGVGHVGIYIGNNKVVHAGSTATGIHTSTANYRSVNCVRRIVK